jgi:hypothetical protein
MSNQISDLQTILYQLNQLIQLCDTVDLRVTHQALLNARHETERLLKIRMVN